MIQSGIEVVGIRCSIPGCSSCSVPSFSIDRNRYSSGCTVNADEVQKFYTSDIIKRLSQYAVRQGFAKIDTGNEAQGNPSLHTIHNTRYRYICPGCIDKQLDQYEQLQKFVSRKKKSTKPKDNAIKQ
jgi:hypothetical protein